MAIHNTKKSAIPTSTKILFGVILGLAIAAWIYVLTGDGKDQKVMPLNAEQQELVSEPQAATIGDIIEVNPGFQGIQTRHWIIKGEDPQQRGIFMSPITQYGYIGTGKYVSWEEFTRNNTGVIPLRSEEWATIMRLYMGPNDANSYSLALSVFDSQSRRSWSMMCWIALNDSIDDDWVRADHPDSLSE